MKSVKTACWLGPSILDGHSSRREYGVNFLASWLRRIESGWWISGASSGWKADATPMCEIREERRLVAKLEARDLAQGATIVSWGLPR